MLTMMATTNKRTKLLAEAYGAAGGIACEGSTLAKLTRRHGVDDGVEWKPVKIASRQHSLSNAAAHVLTTLSVFEDGSKSKRGPQLSCALQVDEAVAALRGVQKVCIQRFILPAAAPVSSKPSAQPCRMRWRHRPASGETAALRSHERVVRRIDEHANVVLQCGRPGPRDDTARCGGDGRRESHHGH